MKLDRRIQNFLSLRNQLKRYLDEYKIKSDSILFKIVKKQNEYNAWFTEENILFSIKAIVEMLNDSKLKKWIYNYPSLKNIEKQKKVAIIMAGNVPLVGFHDLLSVLIVGHKAIIKTSSKDNILPQFIKNELIKLDSEFEKLIQITDNKPTDFDAIIATGSNNTSRYFEYYFGKYPNIIRKNRNTVAVLTGKESDYELAQLGEDVFRYFGLGCRNVSKLYVPDNYSFDNFFKNIFKYKNIINHHKYAANYDYNKAILLLNQDKFLDNNFLIIKESQAIASSVSVLHYESYNDLKKLESKLKYYKNEIQCIVANSNIIAEPTINFGEAQNPQLWDYADNIDTIEFLLNI